MCQWEWADSLKWEGNIELDFDVIGRKPWHCDIKSGQVVAQ